MVNSSLGKAESKEEKKRRVRRIASEIPREYSCYVEKCGKSYGTEASLTQHIKIKHEKVYENKEYEEYIVGLRKKMNLTGEKNTGETVEGKEGSLL
jgi:hypothetical protein